MAQKRIELPQGTLDLLILRTLALEPQHGWAISERIHQISSDVLLIQQGSLYPALHRLEYKKMLKATWKVSETGREAKFYELSALGRAHLKAETENWSRLTDVVGLILKGTLEGLS
jgi:transcriptional regulator